MIILLPPSEGKSDEVGQGSFTELHPNYTGDLKPVLKHLKSLKGDAVGKFIGVKDAQKAGAFHKGNLSILKNGSLPALERYTGVVYSHIEYSSLRAKKRAENQIQIVSGMFGLISGGTAIPEYKLPLNTWLRNYWLPINTERLASLNQKGPIISLLPQSYAKAVHSDETLHVDFKLGGGKKLAGHFGKAIKGKFVRFLIDNDIQSVKDFSEFSEDGFSFDGEHFIQP